MQTHKNGKNKNKDDNEISIKNISFSCKHDSAIISCSCKQIVSQSSKAPTNVYQRLDANILSDFWTPTLLNCKALVPTLHMIILPLQHLRSKHPPTQQQNETTAYIRINEVVQRPRPQDEVGWVKARSDREEIERMEEIAAETARRVDLSWGADQSITRLWSRL